MSVSTIVCRGYGQFGGAELLPVLGYGALVTRVNGPLMCHAASVFLPGAKSGQSWKPGAMAGDAYVPGGREGIAYRPGARRGDAFRPGMQEGMAE